jgi:hypothetical protein
MATITTLSCTDDLVTAVLDDASTLVPGEYVTIFGTGYNKIDGVRLLITVDTDTDTVTFASQNNQDDVAEYNPPNAVLTARVTWIDDDDVTEWLGIAAATANDEAFIGTCVDAANCYAYRVRYEAGYKDNPVVSPCPSSKLGTTMYAATLYRERGSVDSFASFDQLGTAVPFGSMGRIKQLLGVGRPQVG